MVCKETECIYREKKSNMLLALRNGRAFKILTLLQNCLNIWETSGPFTPFTKMQVKTLFDVELKFNNKYSSMVALARSEELLD